MAESSACSSTAVDSSQPQQQASVACQTDSLELDEATLRNEMAMSAYLDILSVLDDDKQPVYHDLGADYANKMFLQQAMADDEDPEEDDDQEEEEEAAAAELADQKTPTATAQQEFAVGSGNAGSGNLQSLESQVIEAEWSLRCKLAQVRELAKHPVQRWLEGSLPHADGVSFASSGSPYDSRAQSVRSSHVLLSRHQQQQQQQLRLRHNSSGQATATLSHCSRPSSVAALSEVFVSDSDEDSSEEEDNDNDKEDHSSSGRAAAKKTKSEMTFYNCAVHGVEVPESFVRIKLRGVEEDQEDPQKDNTTS